MVKTSPLPPVSVGALYAILTMCFFRKVMQPVTPYLLHGRAVGRIIEIAGHYDCSIGIIGIDGVDGLTQTVGNSETKRTRVTFTSVAARSMDYKDMEGIRRVTDDSTSIENVASGTHTIYRFYPKGIAHDGRKRKWRIKQGHINSSKIGRLCHQILIARIPQ